METKKNTVPMPLIDPVGSFTGKPTQWPQPNPAASPYSPTEPPPPPPQLLPGQTSPYQDPNYVNRQQAQKALGYAMPLQAGIGAGSQVTATPRADDAILQAGGAGLAGAAGGAVTGAMIGAAGGPIGAAGGAVIGGIAGLVTGGIQAYTGLRASRDNRRKEEKALREMIAREERRYNQQRADQQEQQRYDRRTAALQSQWLAMQTAGRKVNELIAQGHVKTDRFVSNGR